MFLECRGPWPLSGTGSLGGGEGESETAVLQGCLWLGCRYRSEGCVDQVRCVPSQESASLEADTELGVPSQWLSVEHMDR